MKRTVCLLLVLSTLAGCHKEEKYIPCNNPPSFNDQAFSVPENSPVGTTVGTVALVTANPKARFSITGGNESGAFKIDRMTGVLSVADSILDFEIQSVFEIVVETSDSTKCPITASGIVKVALEDQQPTTNGLVSYFPFQGNLNDEFGNNNGTGNNANLLFGVHGSNNEVVSLDGTTSYVDLGDPFDYNARTISVWFNVLSSSSTYGVLYCSDNTNIVNGFTAIFVDKNGATPVLHFNAMREFINTPIIENQWYNATIVVDKLHIKGYLNGEFVGAKDATDYFHSGNGTANAVLGTLRTLNLEFFNGLADDVRIYNRALADDEIRMLYAE